MNGAAWLLAIATLGVDYGWRLDNSGQLEYIIQIPPSQLETLRDSPEGISSSIPPEVLRHVKRFRIVVGTAPVPKDPLPEFNPGQELGAVTPLKIDTSQVNPAAGEFDDFGGLVQPALESSVTPIRDPTTPIGDPAATAMPARSNLPGPAAEAPLHPDRLVEDTLPIPPLPNMDRPRDLRGSLFPDGPLATTNLPGATIRRETSDSWRPNVSAPGVEDTLPDARNPSTANVNSPTKPNPALPTEREINPSRYTLENNRGETPRDRTQAPLILTVIALCFSIGGNVYLGWIAWGYYLKYRESFESWRNSWSTPN